MLLMKTNNETNKLLSQSIVKMYHLIELEIVEFEYNDLQSVANIPIKMSIIHNPYIQLYNPHNRTRKANPSETYSSYCISRVHKEM